MKLLLFLLLMKLLRGNEICFMLPWHTKIAFKSTFKSTFKLTNRRIIIKDIRNNKNFNKNIEIIFLHENNNLENNNLKNNNLENHNPILDKWQKF